MTPLPHSIPFVEREPLVERLRHVADDTLRGRGRLICVLGEGGAGKSTLLRVFSDGLQGGPRFLWAACEDMLIPEPLGPIYDWSRQADWGDVSHDAATRLPLFNAWLSRLESVPTIAVLEDVHWADDATLAFIRFVGRRLRDKQVTLLITARDDSPESQAKLRRALADVPTDDVVRLNVPPLSEGVVRDLARLCGGDGPKIFSLTAGNAFMVSELLRNREDVPASVRDALLKRAERLDPAARLTLEAVSVFARRLDITLLKEICEVSGDSELEQGAAAGLLVVDADHVAFRHEMARHIVSQAMPRARRVDFERRALAALKRRSPHAAARIVHHALACDDASSIVEYAPRAGAAAAEMGAHREAAQYFEAALQHGSALEAAQRASLLEKSAFELQLTGAIAEAIERYGEALALHQSRDDAVRSGDVLRLLSRLSYNAANRVQALAYGEDAVLMLERLGETPELAMACANMALIKALMDDAEAGQWAERAVRLAENVGRQDALADALTARFVTRRWIDIEGARADFAKSVELALALKRDELVARSYCNFACIELVIREAERTRALLDAGLAYCRARDLDTWTTYMQGVLAQLELREGRWASARENAEASVGASASPLLRFQGVAALYQHAIRTGQSDPTQWRDGLTFDAEPQRLLIYAPILAEQAWIEGQGREDALRALEKARHCALQTGNTWVAAEIAFWRRKLGSGEDMPSVTPKPFALLFAGEWKAAAAEWEAMSAPYDQALALLEGDRAATRDAVQILDSLGAHRVIARVRADLGRNGARLVEGALRAAPAANAWRLTDRQRDVLALLKDELNNTQIAERLGLSTRTVDVHVSAILSRLRVPSRTMAIAKARDADGDKIESRSAEVQPADFWIKSRGGAVRVPLRDVIWFGVDGDYVILHAGSADFLTHESLANVEQRLPGDDFLRVHRSAIVRKSAIVAIERADKGTLSVRLTNGDRVRVSGRYRSVVAGLSRATSL